MISEENPIEEYIGRVSTEMLKRWGVMRELGMDGEVNCEIWERVYDAPLSMGWMEIFDALDWKVTEVMSGSSSG